MPYVITTHRHLDDPTAEFLPGALPGVSRRAVATLKEAIKSINDEIYHQEGELRADQSMMIDDLPEAGGSVGPLPDGTEIEVERPTGIEREQLRLRAGLSPRCTDQEWADAYNARHA